MWAKWFPEKEKKGAQVCVFCLTNNTFLDISLLSGREYRVGAQDRQDISCVLRSTAFTALTSLLLGHVPDVRADVDILHGQLLHGHLIPHHRCALYCLYLKQYNISGLGDISPSAPNNAPSWTLFAHVFMLVFSMTFIGLSQHALDRRIELSFAYIENSIHMYFRTLQVT